MADGACRVRVLAVALACLAALLGAAGGALAATPGLTGWLGDGTAFPGRAVVLQVGGGTLSLARLHVTENGAPVRSPTLTALTTPRSGDFGLMIAVDQSTSMAARALPAAMRAITALAARRSAGTALGVVTFDATATPYADLSTDGTGLQSTLASTPWTGPGDAPVAAEQLALAQLAQARMAYGAVLVISDGVGLSAPAAAVRALDAQAAAAHVPLITIGVADRASTPASLRALAATAPAGEFVSTAPARLGSELAAVSGAVTRGTYVLRYRSQLPAATRAALAVTASGLSGAVQVSYRAPGSPAPAPRAVSRRLPAHAPRPTAPGLAAAPRLARRPGFASGGTAPAAHPQTFWKSSAAVDMIAGMCAVLLGLSLTLALYRPSKRPIRARVESFIPTEHAPPEEQPAAAHERMGPLRGLQHGAWWPPFVEAVQVSRSRRTPIELVKRAAIIGVLFALILVVLTGSVLLGLLPLVAWPFLLRSYVYRAAERQRAKFRDTLPVYLQDLASAIRVGRSFIGAVAVVADGADEPTKSELERAVTDEALGRPLEQCLEMVGRRMASTDMDQVALIAALNRRSGANVAESLDRVAEGARERADLYREMKALTAQAKMSSLVLTGLPGVLLLGLSLISPTYAHPLFHTTPGIAGLVAGTIMVVMGWKVMQKISTVDV